MHHFTHVLVDPVFGFQLGLGNSPEEAWKHAETECAVGTHRNHNDEVGVIRVAAPGKVWCPEMRKVVIREAASDVPEETAIRAFPVEVDGPVWAVVP